MRKHSNVTRGPLRLGFSVLCAFIPTQFILRAISLSSGHGLFPPTPITASKLRRRTERIQSSQPKTRFSLGSPVCVLLYINVFIESSSEAEGQLTIEYTDQCITVFNDFHVVVILQWFGELVIFFSGADISVPQELLHRPEDRLVDLCGWSPKNLLGFSEGRGV